MTVKDLDCLVCKSTFRFTHLRGILPKYCSEECKAEWRKYQDRENSKQYRKRNPEKVADTQKRYRESNLEKLKEYNRKYYEENKERILESNREYYQREYDRIAKRRRAHYEENIEHVRDYNREYRSKNMDKILEACHRRNAKKRDAFVEDVNILVLLEESDWTCGICGGDIPKEWEKWSPLTPHIDHIVPLSKGGEHSYANTQAAHSSCNIQKRDKLDGWQDIKPYVPEEVNYERVCP